MHSEFQVYSFLVLLQQPDMQSKSNYGSVSEAASKAEEGRQELDEEYNVENTRFLTSTNEERHRQFLNALFPILMFVLIMGSIVFLLGKDFNHLYPGPGGDVKNHGGGLYHEESSSESQKPSSININSSTSMSTNSEPVENTQKAKYTQNSEAGYTPQCTSHSKCKSGGLTGLCCPTAEGIFLDCCN